MLVDDENPNYLRYRRTDGDDNGMTSVSKFSTTETLDADIGKSFVCIT